ncbi:MAG TPA: cytochrome b [Rhizomicrobium sp.]|jgi:cytochrome b561|nr:cytochrome b [Rhizomicrobium sp.]
MPAKVARYNGVAMTFHWVIAALIVVNIGLGLYMAYFLTRDDPMDYTITQWHKSVGLLVLVLSLARLGWRLVNPVPRLPAGMHPVVAGFAHFTHYLFYFLIIVIPLTGWIFTSASPLGNGTDFFGLFTWPNLPGFAGHTREQLKPVHDLFHGAHVYLAWSAIVLLPIHIAAALYHHFLRGDDVLRRMTPGATVRDA